jgi:hypothetical protein
MDKSLKPVSFSPSFKDGRGTQSLRAGMGVFIYRFGIGVRILHTYLKKMYYTVTNLTSHLDSLEMLEPEKGFSKDLRKFYSATMKNALNCANSEF